METDLPFGRGQHTGLHLLKTDGTLTGDFLTTQLRN